MTAPDDGFMARWQVAVARLRLQAEAPDAVLDDHTAWRRPLVSAANRLRLLGLLSLGLIAATAAAMISLAGELGLSLHLGGGVEPGDSLDSFKRGFANANAEFRTHEVVCDPAEYERLTRERGEGSPGFFPAYRATETPL